MSVAAASVRERLAAEPARGLGCAAEIAASALGDEQTLRDLVDALGDERAVVVARAANGLKKVQQAQGRALDRYSATLVRAAMRCAVLEARWNLWLVLGGLPLQGRQRAMVVDGLLEALASASALERVSVMQSLADLSVADTNLNTRVQAVLKRGLQDTSAAVRARSRRLLAARKTQIPCGNDNKKPRK